MIHRVDERLRDEAQRFRLVFACPDCASFDPGRRPRCSLGFPDEPHSDAALDARRRGDLLQGVRAPRERAHPSAFAPPSRRAPRPRRAPLRPRRRGALRLLGRTRLHRAAPRPRVSSASASGTSWSRTASITACAPRRPPSSTSRGAVAEGLGVPFAVTPRHRRGRRQPSSARARCPVRGAGPGRYPRRGARDRDRPHRRRSRRDAAAPPPPRRGPPGPGGPPATRSLVGAGSAGSGSPAARRPPARRHGPPPAARPAVHARPVEPRSPLRPRPRPPRAAAPARGALAGHRRPPLARSRTCSPGGARPRGSGPSDRRRWPARGPRTRAAAGGGAGATPGPPLGAARGSPGAARST